MTKVKALANLLKDGNWHSHLELREVGGTDFRARIGDLDCKLLETPYELESRWALDKSGTKDWRMKRSSQQTQDEMEQLTNEVFNPQPAIERPPLYDPRTRDDYAEKVERGRKLIEEYRKARHNDDIYCS